MSQSIGSSIGYSRKRLKRLKRPSLSLSRYVTPTVTSNLKVTITSNNSTTTKSCIIYPMVPFPVNLSDP